MSTTIADNLRWVSDAAGEEGGRGEATPTGHAHSPPDMSPAQFFLEGPGRRITSALQIMTSALHSASSNNNSTAELASNDAQPVTGFIETSNGSVAKTIVAADNEVSNGFVKDGKMLPYVFEASESGARKRSSKILPVCGVCGKRFVCVTTMKRHLVTHTGEKPFSCKICGKQYTQKGNLRVHERTHRNDRPFECNICQQKFYRKEPMQKHQWRQHGIVHFKSRPPLPCGQLPPLPSMGSGPASQSNSGTATPTTIMPPKTTEGVLYNSLVDRIKAHGLESFQESSRGLMDGPSRPMLPPQHAPRPRGYPAGQPEDLSSHERRSVSPSPVRHSSPSPQQQPHYQHSHDQLPPPAMQHHMVSIYRESQLQHLQQRSRSSPPPPGYNYLQRQEVTLHKEVPVNPPRSYESPQPDSAAAKFAAFIAEHRRQQEENKRNAEQPQEIPTDFSTRYHGEVDSISHRVELAPVQVPVGSPANARLLTTLLPRPISPLSPDQDETVPEPEQEVEVETHEDLEDVQYNPEEVAVNEEVSDETQSEEAEAKQHHPLNMKKMLARAYEAEQQQIAKEQVEEEEAASPPETPEEQDVAPSATKELVECQCKSCGNVFIVLDPYNFRCNQCGAKYTSLPTHMIADPLQCIGCTEVFPHKPALKAHQMSGAEKERPFKCCKCGYGFRQKAHLQKHQWRIHRRKIEHDALVNNQAKDVTKITIQDIINHGVERSLKEQQSPASPVSAQPLDLSPTKSLLLASPPSSSYSITSSSSNLLELVGAIPNHRFANAPQAINPLLDNHKPNMTLPMSTPNAESVQVLKRIRTEDAASHGSHHTLPPINGLQKPSGSYQGLSLRIGEDKATNLTMKASPRPPSQLSPNSFKHSAWLGGQKQMTETSLRQADVQNDLRDLTKRPTNEATDLVRNDLLRANLQGQMTQDIRTV